MKIVELTKNKEVVCEEILRDLPEWFQIESAIQDYLKNIPNSPTFVAFENEQILGFLVLKLHNPFSAEIYVMGTKKKWQRKGIGSALLQHAENYLKTKKYEFLSVKTLSASHPSPEYAATRKFYTKAGFKPLEELTHLWDAQNPCLIMIKSL